MTTWIHVYDALAGLRIRAEERERRRLGLPATQGVCLLATRQAPEHRDQPCHASVDAERRKSGVGPKKPRRAVPGPHARSNAQGRPGE